MPIATSIALGALSVIIFFFFFIRRFISRHEMEAVTLPTVPEVPGRLPLVGHLLQLKEKAPYKTFTKWAEQHGPVYSIQTGASTLIVLNNTDVAKEAMVTRYPSISTRKLSKALNILTANKCMVAMSDYNEFHKMAKQCILTNVLGPSAQKRHRGVRDTMIENLLSRFHAHVKDNPFQLVNFRKMFESELFRLSMKEAVGKVVESLYVKEFGTTLSEEDMLRVLVLDLMEGAIEVDWRDFFPYLRWVPNNVENKIKRLAFRRDAVMNALISDAKTRIASEQELYCYVDYLLSEAKSLTEQQLSMLLWETIIESSDTTLVSTEWAMYELGKNQKKQDRLFKEIQAVCGSKKFTEENIADTPYLSAVFHETLRRHGPVPIVPLRYAHEATEVGGYYIPAGSEIAINIYGCNMDKNQWENSEEWMPERFLDAKYNPSDLYKTMAFGAGKRVCAGSLQAYLIACTAIGRMVQEFQWNLRDGDEETVDTVGLTTHKLDPLHAIIRPRN